MLCADDTEDSRTLPSRAAESTRVDAAVPTDTSHCRLRGGPHCCVCAMFGNDVAVSGCWFHLARLLVKRIRKLVLTDAACQNDSHTQTVSGVPCLLRCYQLVTLCPHLTRCSSLSDDQSPSKTLMQQLIRYVSRQWLNKSTIGPSRLSVYETVIREPKTMSRFHAGLRRIKVSHPNLFTFPWTSSTNNRSQPGRH